MDNCDGFKNIDIGQSAAKRRIAEGSETMGFVAQQDCKRLAVRKSELLYLKKKGIVNMYDKDEIVKIKWSKKNKKYYENIGYNYTKIGDSLDVRACDLPWNSHEKITATCDCDGCSNTTKVPYRNYNKALEKYGHYRCKSCAIKDYVRQRTKKSHERLYELFLEKCREHNCIPITTLDTFHGADSFVEYICPVHGIMKTYMSNIRGSNAWCYKCGKASMASQCKLTPDEVKRRVESKNNNILLNLEDYINTKTKNLRVICGTCHEEFITSLSSMDNSEGRCSKCGLEKSFEYHDNRKIIYYNKFAEMCDESGYTLLSSFEEYKNCFSKLRFVCPKHGEQSVNYVKFYSGQRCPQCGIESSHLSSMLTQDEVETRINSINDNVLLNKEDYCGNSIVNLRIQCSCGNVYVTSLANYENQSVNRCPQCIKSISKGEFKIASVLDKYKIPYIREYRFLDCKDKRPLPFDFYIEDFNCIIEFDGIQHFEPVYGQEQFDYILRHDNIKNNYCHQNNIRIIRIPYWDYDAIEDIITHEFNINKIKYITYPIK